MDLKLFYLLKLYYYHSNLFMKINCHIKIISISSPHFVFYCKRNNFKHHMQNKKYLLRNYLLQNGLMGVSAVSHARIKVTKEDNGVRISCRVTNPALPYETLQDHLSLNVTCTYVYVGLAASVTNQ